MKTPKQHVAQLGKLVKDKLTGFTGRISSVVFYISGCTQYCAMPQIKEDGKFPEGVYIDYQRLEIVADSNIEVVEDDNGCCQAPSRS